MAQQRQTVPTYATAAAAPDLPPPINLPLQPNYGPGAGQASLQLTNGPSPGRPIDYSYVCSRYSMEIFLILTTKSHIVLHAWPSSSFTICGSC
jgi:hypothetical protein